MRTEVIVHRPRGGSHSLPLNGQLSIGRGPENDVVIPNLRVSWNHALVWDDGDGVKIADLGSRNGTVLDGRPVKGTTAWVPESLVKIGNVELTMRRLPIGKMPPPMKGMAVEDVATGMRYPLRTPHVVIGDTPEATLRIAGAEPVVLISHPEGEVWLGSGTEDRPLAVGEVFEVASVALRLVEIEVGRHPTASDDDGTPQYGIEVAFDSETGPWARVSCERTGRTHTFQAPNRVSLLYFLAEAHHQDLERGHDEVGWRSNASACVAVWGKVGRDQDPSLLKALLHNVRSELREVGMDPWCLEKRRGYVRLRVRTSRIVR